MNTRSNLYILYTILVAMIAQAYGSNLTCYVCDNCSEVTASTPKQACDATFFNKESTLPHTTIDPVTEISTIPTTDAKASTVSTVVAPPPTPPTAGPAQTTKPLPTPPNPGTVAGPIDFQLEKRNGTTISETNPTTLTQQTTTDITDTTTILPTTILEPVKITVSPAEIRMRPLRSISHEEFTYHCYKVGQKINGTTAISRGCSRIGPKQAVCTQLEQANNKKNYTGCSPCTNTLCNSSSAIGTSTVAIILGFLGALLFNSSA